MARSMNQKLKVLYIIKLLAGTDASHVVTMNEILEELRSHGISAERKSIYDDLDALRTFGFEVVSRRERPAGYYLKNAGSIAGLLAVPGILPGLPADQKKEKEITPEPEKPSASVRRPDWLRGKTKIELLCSETAAESILNELGGGVSVRGKSSSGTKKGSAQMVSLKLKAAVGDAFYGWLAGYGCKVRMTAPPSAMREYRKYLKEIRSLYKEEA
ncbi:WYL domain-containing protein [Qiania dongpingensis]|uniref:FokI D3 domain-containing protein n=1 Tax=Qiania dongpingensis TaxID=2763669 RepID=A0A7G9G1N5_9FIRM|nr:WYL domain-containing protein [Qiania dongpingensis]QNM04717.1 hypothetical protein H9Q78_09640 [Qiania dongpingensis]